MADQQELLDQLQAQLEDPNRMPTPQEDEADLESDVDQTDKAGAPPAPAAPNPIQALIAKSQAQGPAQPGATPPPAPGQQPPAAPAAPAASQGPSDTDRLGAAQQQANKQAFLSNLLRSFQGALQAGSRGNYKTDNGVANAIDENAKQNLSTTEKQIANEAARRKEARDTEMEKIQKDKFQQELMKSKLDFQDMQANNDPASPQSKIAQDRVLQMQKEMGQPVNEDAVRQQSGATLFKYFPFLQQDLAKYYQVQNWEAQRKQQSEENAKKNQLERDKLKETIQSRKDLMSMNNQNKLDVQKEKAEAAKTAANEKTVGKLNEAMKKDLDASKSRYGNMAQEEGRRVQATHLNSLLTDAAGNINNLPSQQVEEAAVGLNRMISGAGGGADRQVQALVPHTVIGDAQKLRAWLTNEPQGANQQAFLKYMHDTVQRQQRVAEENVKNARIQLAGSAQYKKLKQLSPDDFNQNLSQFGLNPDDFDESGAYTKGGPTPQGGASQGPEGEITQRNGKTYKWNPAVGKYQLYQGPQGQ